MKSNWLEKLREKKRRWQYVLKSVAALYSHLFGFKREEYKYAESYSSEPCENELGTCLIAMFDGKQIHCGLTDRFKGICTAYEFSREFGLRFYLYHVSPFELTDYLIPNQYDWRVDKAQIRYNKNTSVPVFLNDWQSDVSFHKRYLAKVIKNNPGKQIHLYINSPYYLDKYRINYDFLFKPSNKLQSAITEQLQRLGRKYVAVSFRFLQLLGDFKEEHAKFITLSEKDQQTLMEQCENKVLELRKERHITSRMLLTADSTKYLEYMQSRHDFVYVVPGSVAHIDNDHSHSDSIYMKTFLDMYMLSQATCVYQLCTGMMYNNSAFARQAALLGGAEYIKIEF